MSKQIINLGQTANDRTGDPLRVAFEKVNENFDELYSLAGADVQIPVQTGNSGKILTTNGTTLSWTPNDRLVNGPITISLNEQGSLVFPAGSLHYDLGAGEGVLSHNIEVNSNIWSFDHDGNLTLPTGGSIYGLFTIGDEGANVQVDHATEKVYIRTYANGAPSSKEWEFGTDGNLTVPNTSTTNGPTGTIYTFTSDYNSTTPALVSANNINLVDNIDTQNISAGWIITFANSVQKTVTISSAGPGSWDLEWSGALSLTGSDVWPLTVQSADYSAGSVVTSGAVQQRSTRTVTQGNTTVNGGQTGIIYSGDAWQTGFKLVIMAETRLDNNTDDVDHTQICEALISANYNSNAEPIMSVYGLTYTSPDPLATFAVQRTGNTSSGKIEVVATNIQTQYNLQVSVHAIQFGSYYD